MALNINPAIEASSLSSLTAIASDPPPHPKALAANCSPPLTLYIARVPGSRDVFLTPMKPREKTVTAEDVQSSLYYIHINTTQDPIAMESPGLSSANSNASELPPIIETGVIRKPVPPPRSPLRRSPGRSPDPPYPTETQRSSQEPGLQRSSRSQVARKPVLSDITNSTIPQQYAPGLPDLPRRPLPPPPKEEVCLEVQSPVATQHQTHPSGAGSLTLIRRDPSTSSQWNVASIHDPPVEEVSSTALLSPVTPARIKKGGNPLYLDITNPGYMQFVSRSRPQSRTSTSTSSSDSEPAPEGIFRRRLYMPGSRFADHTYGHKFTPSASSLRPADALPSTLRNRSSIDGSVYPDLAAPSMDRRSKGYSFTSPWDGRCEFHTSTSGRALKCRHYLPEHQGGSAEVSELRFNLPTSARRSQVPTSKADKRSSYFTGLHRRMRSEDTWGGGPSPDGNDDLPSYVFDDDGNLDLSLGQERAGGGFGGKQAKLGKLIIYPEGIGMLDLLVAANVGLWWRAWERA